MLQQVRCFGCGTEISNKYDNYLRYKRDLGISTEDAIDKVQLQKTCCRMTMQTTTEVSERVLAAGRPSIEGMKRTVVDTSPYPVFKPERKERVQVTEAYVEANPVPTGKVTVTVYTNVLQPYPKETVVNTKPKSTSAPIKKLPMFAREIFQKAKWDLSDPESFPVKEAKDLPFWNVDVVYQIPVGRKFTNFTVPPQTLLKDVLIAIAEFILTPVPKFYDQIIPEISNPNIVLHLLDIRADSRYPTIYDFHVGKTTVLRMDPVPGKPNTVQVFFQKFGNPLETTPQARLEASLSNHIEDRFVETSTITDGILSLKFNDKTVFQVSDFALHTEEGLFEGVEAQEHITLLQNAKVLKCAYYDPKFLGRDPEPRGVLILFKNKVILECLTTAKLIVPEQEVKVFPLFD